MTGLEAVLERYEAVCRGILDEAGYQLPAAHKRWNIEGREVGGLVPQAVNTLDMIEHAREHGADAETVALLARRCTLLELLASLPPDGRQALIGRAGPGGDLARLAMAKLAEDGKRQAAAQAAGTVRRQAGDMTRQRIEAEVRRRKAAGNPIRADLIANDTGLSRRTVQRYLKAKAEKTTDP